MYDYVYLPVNEIIEIIKSEMGWSDFGGTAEHLDCDLHNVPMYKNTIVIPNITPSTFHNSGLLRQGIISKDEAIKIENTEKASEPIPNDLVNFLKETNISYDEYIRYVKYADKTKYVSNIQKWARDIYHRFRKF